MNVIELSRKVLIRLSNIDNEIEGGNSSEQLIFPKKVQAKGQINRISEQELRLLFIEEFKKKSMNTCFIQLKPQLKKNISSEKIIVKYLKM